MPKANGHIDITIMAFLMLRRYLPQEAVLTSSYRSPADQLGEIQRLAAKAKVAATNPMIPERPNTWLPTLEELRKRGYKVNAPTPGTAVPVSPHSAHKIVLDVSGADLEEIVKGCKTAEHDGLMGFTQILPEPKNNCVHIAVKWISKRAWEELHAELGYLYA